MKEMFAMMLVLSLALHTCCTCLLLNASSTYSPSIYPFIRTHLLISALFMHLPPVLWAWKRAPATHLLGARILIYTHPAAVSALPQHLPFPFSVIVLSSQYPFQRGPIWFSETGFFLCDCYPFRDYGTARSIVLL